MVRDHRKRADKKGAEVRNPVDRLTEREVEVLELVVQGKSNAQIARALSITPHTAKKHVSSLLYKLGVRSRTEAAVVYTKAIMSCEL